MDKKVEAFLKKLEILFKQRDWVAHGRNPEKPPPVRKIDFEKSFEVIKSVMDVLA